MSEEADIQRALDDLYSRLLNAVSEAQFTELPLRRSASDEIIWKSAFNTAVCAMMRAMRRNRV